MKSDSKKSPWIQPLLNFAVAIWLATLCAMGIAIYLDASAGAVLVSSKDLIAPLVAATGVLIAVLAYTRDRSKIERDRDEARSKIFLEQAKQSLEQAFDLLKDLNQDRAKWVRAARLILESKQLGEAIPSADYKQVYALAAAQVRHRFYEAFMIVDEKGQKVALPPAFFFGLADWRTTELSIDEMALEASPSTLVRSVSRESPLPELVAHGLSTHSVVAVFEFVRFPDVYDDLLDKVDTAAWKKWPELYGATQGAYRYLEHREEYVLIGKNMYSRSTARYAKPSPGVD